jgi:hypothetical protein
MSVASSPARATRLISLDIIFLLAAAGILLAQILLGTAVEFACGVFAIYLVVILTWKALGFDSIAGVMLGYCTFQFVGMAEVLKVLYLQPGDTNLRSPDVTIGVLLVGMIALCSAALVVSNLLKNRQIIAVDPSPEALATIRNICFGVEVMALLTVRLAGGTAEGDAAVGGIAGVARDFVSVGYFSIAAETWRVLKMTDGRRSTSPALLAMASALVFAGVLFDSKALTAQPAVIYFVVSWAYRRRLTLRQWVTAAIGVAIFASFIYPVVHILRADKTATGISFEAVTDYLGEIVVDPGKLAEDWAAYKVGTFDPSAFGYAYQDSLNYLGYQDDLLARFTYIANTDGLVDAVDKDGTYGWGLIGESFAAMIPTFVYADKPRYGAGDQLLWFYGMEPYGLVGYPTIGLFATSFATGGWLGVFLIPLVLGTVSFLFFCCGGTRASDSILAAFFLAMFFNVIGGSDVMAQIGFSFRALPEDILFLVMTFYAADWFLGRKRRKVRLSAAAGQISGGGSPVR